jgi:hypothetical protein
VLVISPLLFIVEDEALPDLLVGALLLALGIGLATVAIRDGGRVGARWVVALGVLVGVAALVKPVAEAALVAPLLTFAAARWPRRAVLRGELLVLAGFAIAVGPFVVHSVIRFGEPSLVRNSGDTLFARVFEIDQRPIPTDTTDGREVAAAIQGEPGVRPYITARVALEKSHGGDLRGVDRRERALAFDAIAKYPFRYAWRTIELSDQFLVQSFASPHVVDVFHPRAGPSATGLSDLLFEVGGWLSRRWWVLSLHGFAFLLAMTVGPRRRRIACISLVAVAAPVALLTAASHGGLPRYSWSLLPITYTVGIAGVVSGVLALRRGARGTPAW